MEIPITCPLAGNGTNISTTPNGVSSNQKSSGKDRKSSMIPLSTVVVLSILLTDPFVVCVQGLSSRQPGTVVRGRNYIHANEKTTLTPSSGTSTLNHPTSQNSFDQLQKNADKVPPPLDITTSSHFIKSNTSLHATKSNEDGAGALSRTHSSRGTLLGITLTFFMSTVALAKMNFLGAYTNDLILRDSGVALLSSVLALLFVKSITTLAAKDILQPRDSRKIIHTLSAPLFMVVWPLFSDLWGARLFAASVPLLQAIRLWLAAMNRGGADSSELAAAISRSGDEKEALGGPFIYVVILFSAIVLCFRDNFAGVMALSAMAAGDGMADIIGRRFGKGNKWFFNKDKSVAGSFAFITASSICSICLGLYLQYVGAITVALPVAELVSKFITISALSAFVELIPGGDDNWSVPISAGILSLLLL